jgi:signal peptidase II
MSDPRSRSPRLWGLAAIVGAFALDQAHKFFMLYVIDIGTRQPIRATPFLDIVLSWNFGISYSLFSAQNQLARYALLAAQLAIVAGLVLWLWRAQRPLVATALGLIVGGALGNVADRLTHGAVADFFFFHTELPVGPLANYVFNLADVAIFCGVALLFLESFFTPRKGAPQSPAPA